MLPIFTSHYSIGTSLLNLNEAGQSIPGKSVSIFDLAKSGDLKEVVLVEDRPDAFIPAYKAADKSDLKLIFGLKLKVCSDINDKSEKSLPTESKIIVFVKNTQGYSDLLKIWNRAATDGFYYTARLDWSLLKSLWTNNLILALPYFSSFLAVNTLTFSSIIPDFPIPDTFVFKEINSELPFSKLIDAAIDIYFRSSPMAKLVETKSILYPTRADFEAFFVRKCIGERTKSDAPHIDDLSSSAFCWEDYQRLDQGNY